MGDAQSLGGGGEDFDWLLKLCGVIRSWMGEYDAVLSKEASVHHASPIKHRLKFKYHITMIVLPVNNIRFEPGGFAAARAFLIRRRKWPSARLRSWASEGDTDGGKGRGGEGRPGWKGCGAHPPLHHPPTCRLPRSFLFLFFKKYFKN